MKTFGDSESSGRLVPPPRWAVYTKQQATSVTQFPTMKDQIPSMKNQLTPSQNLTTMNTQRKQSFNSPTKDVEKEIKTIISTSSAIDSTKSSYIDLRKLQVMQMNAGHKPHLKTQPSTHQASEETMTKWKNRHPSHLTYSTNYMACQERLIFLADVGGCRCLLSLLALETKLDTQSILP